MWAVLLACDRREEGINKKYFGNRVISTPENPYPYKSSALSRVPNSGFNDIMANLRLAGLDTEASQLQRGGGTDCSGVESNPGMILKIVLYLRESYGKFGEGPHLIAGGGRRAGLLLELCTRLGMCIFSVEKEVNVHKEANASLSRYMAKAERNPPIVNILMNTDDLTRESLAGVKTVSRFCGAYGNK